MNSPHRRYVPGSYPAYDETRVIRPYVDVDLSSKTQVLPQVTGTSTGQLRRRVEQLEEQLEESLAQARQETLKARSHADWSLLAMVVSIFCVVLSICVLISILLLGG